MSKEEKNPELGINNKFDIKKKENWLDALLGCGSKFHEFDNHP